MITLFYEFYRQFFIFDVLQQNLAAHYNTTKTKNK